MPYIRFFLSQEVNLESIEIVISDNSSSDPSYHQIPLNIDQNLRILCILGSHLILEVTKFFMQHYL